MSKTAYLVRQFTYGVVKCAECSVAKEFTSVRTRRGKEQRCHMNMDSLQNFSYEAGWRQDKRGRYYCPKHLPDVDKRKPIPDSVRRHAHVQNILL